MIYLTTNRISQWLFWHFHILWRFLFFVWKAKFSFDKLRNRS